MPASTSIQRRPAPQHPPKPSAPPQPLPSPRLPSKRRARHILPIFLLLTLLLYLLAPRPQVPHPSPPHPPTTTTTTLSAAHILHPPSASPASLANTVASLRAQAPTLPVTVHHFSALPPPSPSDPYLRFIRHTRIPTYLPLLRFQPTTHPAAPVLHLLTGTQLAPHAISWLHAAYETYANRTDIAAFFLDHVRVRRRNNPTAHDHLPDTWTILDDPHKPTALFYRLAIGSAAFVPFAGTDLQIWSVFSEWLSLRRSDWYKYPSGPGVDDTPISFRHLPERNWTRGAWNVWFSKFLQEYKLAVVYPSLPHAQALAWHEANDFSRDVRPRGQPIKPYSGNATWSMPDIPIVYAANGEVVDDSRFSRGNVAKIVDLARKQGGVVSFTMVNKVFLDTAKSWLCNVDAAGFRPNGLVWAVTDVETRDAMAAIPDTHTVLLDEVQGGKETGHEFGNPGYWKLMLERTALIGEILRNGVAVFAFETDAIWLEDPQPYIQHLVRQDADIVGTINTRAEVSGNFFYLRPTLATRRMWDEITNEFEKAFNNAHFEKKAPTSWTYIENDQSMLTKLVLRNETWRKSYPLSFLTLDMELFTDGRWYKPEEGFYTSERARHPVVINNNFVIGVDEKTARAKKWGHWFWDEKEEKCLDAVVKKAVRKGRKISEGEISMDGHDGAHSPREGS